MKILILKNENSRSLKSISSISVYLFINIKSKSIIDLENSKITSNSTFEIDQKFEKKYFIKDRYKIKIKVV